MGTFDAVSFETWYYNYYYYYINWGFLLLILSNVLVFFHPLPDGAVTYGIQMVGWYLSSENIDILAENWTV